MCNCVSIIVSSIGNWTLQNSCIRCVHLYVWVHTWACVVFPYICPTLSTAGFKAQLKPEHRKHIGSFVNTDCLLNLNMCHGAGQSSSCKSRTFSHLFLYEFVYALWRRSLPWGRTGHDAPPCTWSLGSPELQYSCCKSSACLHSGPLWSPTGSNDWWCLDILQENEQTSVMKIRSFFCCCFHKNVQKLNFFFHLTKTT